MAFGQGVYFAVNSSYSETYSTTAGTSEKKMYYAKVLTGDYTKGNKDMRMPPPKKDPNNPLLLFDATVDKEPNPTIFVIFNDNQAYPEYIVTFKAK